MIIQGDCLEVLDTLEENSFDGCITDPPYEIGFVGKTWDKTGISFNVGMWKKLYRVLKPGANILVFGGSRSYHRVACAIEDAGFEIRDCIMWLYGSGFPKSMNISKAIDNRLGNEREVLYSYPRILSSGGIWGSRKRGEREVTKSTTAVSSIWEGWGTTLKPAYEPILLAQKPLYKSFVDNALTWGVAGLNLKGCEVPVVGSEKGRFPANVIHDGSLEVLALFPSSEEKVAKPSEPDNSPSNSKGNIYGFARYRHLHKSGPHYGDGGSAARFFYCAKVSKKERGKMNNHPTVKPLALIQYLCRLIKTPFAERKIIDPFAGSGTTLIAGKLEGFEVLGIEKNPDYVKIIQERLEERSL